jgi:transcriptional regulator with XRE-family HTH domain
MTLLSKSILRPNKEGDMLTDQLRKQLGVRVVQELLTKGWSQKQIAEQAQVSKATINRIVKGHQNVTIGMLLKVLNALDMTPREAFPGEVEWDLNTKEIRRLALLAHLRGFLKTLPPEEQTILVDLTIHGPVQLMERHVLESSHVSSS